MHGTWQLVDTIARAMHTGDYVLSVFLDFNKHSTQLIIDYVLVNYNVMVLEEKCLPGFDVIYLIEGSMFYLTE